MAYSEKVLEHFKNPRNVGTLNKDAKMLVPVSSARLNAAT